MAQVIKKFLKFLVFLLFLLVFVCVVVCLLYFLAVLVGFGLCCVVVIGLCVFVFYIFSG